MNLKTQERLVRLKKQLMQAERRYESGIVYGKRSDLLADISSLKVQIKRLEDQRKKENKDKSLW